jgi:hypothetical protein
MKSELPALPRPPRSRAALDRANDPRGQYRESHTIGLGVPNARVPVGHRFNPYRLFNGIFIPEGVAKYRGISLGAKMIYGRLCRYAGENGEAHPSMEVLSGEIGIGETQARQYLRELMREGFIGCEARADETGRQTSNQYFFLWHEAFDGEIGDTRKKPQGRVRKTEPPTLRISEPWRVRKTEPEENHHQESPKKESQEKKTRDDSGQQIVSDTPQDPQKPEEGPKPLPLKADDENPKTQSAKRPAFEDPRQEFKARVSERHPGTEPEYVLECFSPELSGNNLSLGEFLDFDAKCTTNPRGVKNPAGYYRDLARRLNAHLEAAAFEERRNLNDRMNAFLTVTEPEKPKGPKCPICREPEGKGIVFSTDKKGFEPCSCATPEFAADFREKEAARRNNAIQMAAAKENNAAAT